MAVADALPTGRAIPLDFEAVYEQQLGFVWRTLAAAGVPESRLEDASQDVFVIVHGKLAEFEGRSKLTTWIYAIARHVALDYIRKVSRERRRQRAFAEVPDGEATAPSPEEEAGEVQARRVLLELLERLEPGRRDVFVLVEIEGIPVREVARMLAIKENTAWSRLRLARSDLERHAARLRARDGEGLR
ncbi:MAG TPA: RNA polymerase sigma factor [Kofleriaceae bacterium]|nr:RNA polymerase sigma factor [Kofleriaceae bacterium]